MDTLLIKKLKSIILHSSIKKSFNFSYATQKYTIDFYIKHILTVLKLGISWRNLKLILTDCNWNSVYKVFKKLSSNNIFKLTYIELLKKYIKRTPAKKLKIIYTDTSCIYNSFGNDPILRRNKYFKNKKALKLSIITDNKGVPIMVDLFPGTQYDSKIICEQFKNNNWLINSQNIKHVKYFLADKGYDSKNVRDMIENINICPIIAHNKRNTKNISLLKRLSDDEKIKYKKRILIEHVFGRLKKNYKRIRQVSERYLAHFSEFLFLAFSDMLIKCL